LSGDPRCSLPAACERRRALQRSPAADAPAPVGGQGLVRQMLKGRRRSGTAAVPTATDGAAEPAPASLCHALKDALGLIAQHAGSAQVMDDGRRKTGARAATVLAFTAFHALERDAVADEPGSLPPPDPSSSGRILAQRTRLEATRGWQPIPPGTRDHGALPGRWCRLMRGAGWLSGRPARGDACDEARRARPSSTLHARTSGEAAQCQPLASWSPGHPEVVGTAPARASSGPVLLTCRRPWLLAWTGAAYAVLSRCSPSEKPCRPSHRTATDRRPHEDPHRFLG
jgi:hypothetical protein